MFWKSHQSNSNHSNTFRIFLKSWHQESGFNGMMSRFEDHFSNHDTLQLVPGKYGEWHVDWSTHLQPELSSLVPLMRSRAWRLQTKNELIYEVNGFKPKVPGPTQSSPEPYPCGSSPPWAGHVTPQWPVTNTQYLKICWIKSDRSVQLNIFAITLTYCTTNAVWKVCSCISVH